MTRHVWIDGTKTALDAAALIGQGGEAEVYDLHDGRVLKWWKPVDHPDFDGLPEQQSAVKKRLAEQPAKLRALPGNLPASVIAPAGFALATKKGGECVGYVMPKISGVPLHSYGEPRWRLEHPTAGGDVVAALLALHDAIAGLHRAGVVIGDCNDLNVLVDGRRVHLIDVDSYQYGGFACSMFSERFVDPRLCDAQQLVPVRPHDVDSDWFAFAVMAFRSLLGVGPWGGVAKHVPATQRALRRLSVLASDVVYPRAAKPLQILPDDLLGVFRDWFERDVRGEFPRSALERLRLKSARAAARSMRVCDVRAVRRARTCRRLSCTEVSGGSRSRCRCRRRRAFGSMAARSCARRRLDRSASARCSRGKRGCGSATRSASASTARAATPLAFVFKPDRGGLDDRVALPKIRGRLLDAHAVIAGDRAWLFLMTEQGTTCVVVDAQARVLATEALTDAPWLTGVYGACATGNFLFVPTDDGVARVEIVQNAITATRVFAETAPLVGASDRLVLSPGGLDVIRRRDAIRMQLQ